MFEFENPFWPNNIGASWSWCKCRSLIFMESLNLHYFLPLWDWYNFLYDFGSMLFIVVMSAFFRFSCSRWSSLASSQFKSLFSELYASYNDVFFIFKNWTGERESMVNLLLKLSNSEKAWVMGSDGSFWFVLEYLSTRSWS